MQSRGPLAMDMKRREFVTLVGGAAVGVVSTQLLMTDDASTQRLPWGSRTQACARSGHQGRSPRPRRLCRTIRQAPGLGIQVQFAEARAPADIDKAFSEITNARADAAIVLVSGMLLGERRQPRRPRRQEPAAGRLHIQRTRRCRWPDVLWTEPD